MACVALGTGSTGQVEIPTGASPSSSIELQHDAPTALGYQTRVAGLYGTHGPLEGFCIHDQTCNTFGPVIRSQLA